MSLNSQADSGQQNWFSLKRKGSIQDTSQYENALIGRRLKTGLYGENDLTQNQFLNPYNQEDLPIFTIWTADRMLRDPVVKFGLAVRDGAMMNAEVNITSETPSEARLVALLWEHLWYNYSDIFMQAKHYGRIPGELTFKRVSEGEFKGAVVPDYLKAIHPNNTRVVLVNGQPGGVRVQSGNIQSRGSGVIPMPMAFWITHSMQFSNWYGRSILQGSYQPFYERWAPGGAMDCVQKRVYRDAYNGEIYWVPDRLVRMPDGSEVAWRDMAEGSIEARQAGASMVLMKQFDDNGNELTGYTPPQDTGDGDLVFRNYERNQKEIWFGLGVFEEVINAGDKGSFSGRSVPLMMFLGSVGQELREIIRCVDRDIIRPTVHLWKGSEPGYAIQAVSLIETLTEDLKEPVMGESREQVSRFSDESDYRVTVSNDGIKLHSEGEFIPSPFSLSKLKKKAAMS